VTGVVTRVVGTVAVVTREAAIVEVGTAGVVAATVAVGSSARVPPRRRTARWPTPCAAQAWRAVTASADGERGRGIGFSSLPAQQ
jgi:hypothetical protein